MNKDPNITWAVFAPRSWEHLWEWCGAHQKPVVDPIKRWAIGTYQIGQAMEWTGAGQGVCSQSYAAAIMHFFMCGYDLGLGLDVVSGLPEKLEDLMRLYAFDWPRVLHLVARGTRMVVYSQESKLPEDVIAGRRIGWQGSRYKPDVLSATISELVGLLVGPVLPEQRVQAFYDEMMILTRGG